VTSLLDSALELAARGFPVFPLQPRSKEPYKGSRGLGDATLDAAVIRAWWEHALESNIGLRPPPGVLVVDPDPRNGGFASLVALEAEGKHLPNTLTVRTGRGDGGIHAYYRVPIELVSWPKTAAPGIDLKGPGGYVLAPPSIHPDSGMPYTWLEVRPMSDAPEWLVALGRARAVSTAAVVDEDEGEPQPDDVIERVVAELEPHFTEGRKHAIAYAFGGWARQRGWNSLDVARVIERLPSSKPRARVKDARDGYKANQGWHALREALGEQAASALDAVTPNPRREREAAALKALRGMMPAPAPAPAPAAPAVAGGIVDRLRRVAHAGSPVPSGLGPIDKALRGGFRDEKILVVGGAPGAGKTSLVRQLADSVARVGAAVGWLAADEEPAGIDARRLQALGVPRHLAEKPDDATIAIAERELAPLPFEVYDSADGWTADHVFAALAQRYPDRPRVVVLDSLQTVQTPRSAKLDTRARIDDVIATVKTLSRSPATRASVIVVSELARGAYRSEASAEATADIAAFKESGGIEYGGHTLLVLRTVKDAPDFVEVAMPKNRVGPKVPFTLKMDPETTVFAESFEDPRADREKLAVELAIPDVKKALEGCGWPGLTQTAVEKAVPRDAKTVRKALQLMKERGIASMHYGPRNAALWTLGTLPQPGKGGAMPPPVEPSLAVSQEQFAKAIGESQS
jgi:hypothetical protein